MLFSVDIAADVVAGFGLAFGVLLFVWGVTIPVRWVFRMLDL